MARIPAGHIDRSIARALAGDSKLSPQMLFLSGWSTPTVRHFLNNLCSLSGANYLEVGTHMGSTLLPACYHNPGRFTAVDDFSEFEKREPREHLMKARKRFKKDCHFTFHEADCWSDAILRKVPADINVYFYDGPHRPQDQYQAFVHFDPVFANTFLAVVDDWNWPFVRKATRDAFAFLGYTTVMERELFDPHWWNGIYVALVRKKRASARREPARRTPARRAPRRKAQR